MRREILSMALLGAALGAPLPAGADVKAGVDAWARGDYHAAVDEWRGPAVAGDADAQFNLGQAYKLGRGVPVDPALAESWFHKAALQGHDQAVDNYGLALFQAGRKAEALPWLEKSVARGEPRTQLVLGTMLFNGDGVRRDYPRAYALMSRAAASGLPSAQQTLAQMDGYITPADRQRGTELAQQYAAAPRPAPSSRHQSVRTTDVPPSAVADRGHPPMPPAPVAPHPASTVRPATPAPRAAAPTPRATGAYRIQLGAFRDRGNAEALWARVRGRMNGARADYVAAGGITRLQATGFATRADATRACAAAGGGCVVIAP